MPCLAYLPRNTRSPRTDGGKSEFVCPKGPTEEDDRCHVGASDLDGENEVCRASSREPDRRRREVEGDQVGNLTTGQEHRLNRHEPDGGWQGLRNAEEGRGDGGVEICEELVLENSAWSNGSGRVTYLDRWCRAKVPTGMPLRPVTA